MEETIRLRELKEFLRSRRSKLKPEKIGLPFDGRRRSPGIRREELAWLAGISVSWYTWLEQGRPVRVSSAALARIARALRLSPSDEAYFFSLAAEQKRKPVESGSPSAVGDDLQAALHAMDTVPVFVSTQMMDVVAYNDLANNIFDLDEQSGPYASNHLWRLFMDPTRRALYGESWEGVSLRTVGALRLCYAMLEGQPRFQDMLGDLLRCSQEFASMWSAGHTSPLDAESTTLHHRLHGHFKVVGLRFAALPGSEFVMSLFAPADSNACALFQRFGR
jgi:transcriptional regulator with XRE-family HTH domain